MPISQLVLESPNPHDLPLEDLEGLAEDISELLAQSDDETVNISVFAEAPESAGNLLLIRCSSFS